MMNNCNSENTNNQHLRHNLPLQFLFQCAMLMAILLPSTLWGQVTMTTDTDNSGTIDDNEKVLYLIQTNQFESFYMVPASNGTNVSTNNIPNPQMLWYFLDAGLDGTTQYYYIVSNSANKFICHGGGTANNDTSRGVTLVEKDASNEERCKFKLVEDNTNGTVGFYNIDAKGNPTYYGLNKRNGSVNISYPVRLTNTQFIHDFSSKWKFIPYNGSFNWPDPPFTPSTTGQNYYFKIHNIVNGSYYVSSDASSPKNVTIANTPSNNMAWYFIEVDGSDPWIKYYYIVNPEAGEYMYYKGTVTNGSNQSNAIILKEKTSENEDRFQFIIVQTARTVNDQPVECYTIIPKLLKDLYWNSNCICPTSITDGNPLGIRNGRGSADNNAHWLFETTVYPSSCSTPTITYSSETGKITITATPADAVIHYTTDGVTEPSSTAGTLYEEPFDVSSPVTIKAIASKTGYADSEVATVSFGQVATPTIQNSGSNAISITTVTEGATIYYTTDGSTPTTTSTLYTGPLTGNLSGVTIKAIAVKEGMINSAVGSGSVTLKCATPVIVKTGAQITISCAFPTIGVTVYYTINGGDPTNTSPSYTAPISVNVGDVVKAIAMAPGYDDSDVATKTIREELTPDGEGKYHITSQTEFETFVDMANSADGAQYHYVLDANVTAIAEITEPFMGTFDGNCHTITGITQPFFDIVNGGTVKNVMLKQVAISSSADTVGAIANIAMGYSRIYNCGILPTTAEFPEGTHPSITTTGRCAGGLVGSLRGDSRVVNCFSYADVQAVNLAAGLVGCNTFASNTTVSGSGGNAKYANLRTMVVNCMFYGNITGGTNQYPVYGGTKISNAGTNGINSYNWYSLSSVFTAANGHPLNSGGDNRVGEPTDYYCCFPAEVRYLTQVEFHRSMLNSNRELCGWWVGSNVAPSTLTTAQVQAILKDASLMYKWVVDPNIAPYPILKPFGKYPSIVNGNTGTPWFDRSTANRYEGKQLGTLTVKVKSGTHSSAAEQTLHLPITDMDTLHYDFGYRKVQLPYYNTVFGNPDGADWSTKYAGNYTDSVVTGWKVTSVIGGTLGTFVGGVNKTQTGYSYDANAWQNGYNFADRKCTAKDLYYISGRVFAQGGNYYVPDGVTEITIEAYWGKAIYVRGGEGSYDRVNVTEGTTGTHFAPAGYRDNNVNGATIQTTTISGSLTDANIPSKASVYDYALVLVGNVQQSVGGHDVKHATETTRGFTLMSVDLDFDEEPDYCLEWQLGTGTNRQEISPVRFDFLPVVELGVALKLDGSTNFFSLGCYRSKGHFEVTETAFIRFGQLEYELGSRDDGPIILNGGIFDQYTRGKNSDGNHITYTIVGGHIVLPSFTPGSHVGGTYSTRHCAVNALGGDFSSFYLTGGYNEGVSPYDDNPHCYIDGGRFGTVAAAYKEGIKGDVTWRVNHALIDEFYGGGMMAQSTGNNYKIVKGNIEVYIDSCIVRKYCGGPKFGDMESGKTVTTHATGTIFHHYYGAGNGGTNYVQCGNTDITTNAGDNPNAYDWEGSGKLNTYNNPGQYITKWNGKTITPGYISNYEMEMINTSTGTWSGRVVIRTYFYTSQFATTNTGSVSNTLTGCTILNNFYGAGFLGGVTGDVTSTLDSTRVYGSAFGSGYSASVPKVTIYNKYKPGSSTEYDKEIPKINLYTGLITPSSGGSGPEYYWDDHHGSTSSPATQASPATHDSAYYYTSVPLGNLGAVSGNVTITLKGNTKIGTLLNEGGANESLKPNTGNVFGGGDESAVSIALDNSNNPIDNTGNTTVILQEGVTVLGNVYGGGNEGPVGGNSEVIIKDN